jgi:hypothetical protein
MDVILPRILPAADWIDECLEQAALTMPVGAVETQIDQLPLVPIDIATDSAASGSNRETAIVCAASGSAALSRASSREAAGSPRSRSHSGSLRGVWRAPRPKARVM